jgi:hypothetical protein
LVRVTTASSTFPSYASSVASMRESVCVAVTTVRAFVRVAQPEPESSID